MIKNEWVNMDRPKIRVAQVITRLDWGGSPDIFRILCEHLNSGLYDITIITGHTEFPTAKTKEFLKMFRGRTVTIESLKRDVDPYSDFVSLARLYRIFRIGNFDVVHTHTAKAGAIGRIAANLAGIPVVVHTPHGHNLYGYFGPAASSAIRRVEKILARLTDSIIALTELEKSDYVKFGIALPRKVSVIYQGLELNKFKSDWKESSQARQSFGIKQDEPVIGMIGRLEPVKGSLFFVDAAARIAKSYPQARFVVTGEGSLKPAMEKRSDELGLRGRFIFTGWREDVQRVLSMMDVVVHPSLNEAVGMALIEAQAQGIPIVASRVGGIPEVVLDHKTGILVPPSDPEKTAEAVNGLLADKQKRADMGEAGKVWVYDKFNAETMANKTSALYIELLHKKRRFIG